MHEVHIQITKSEKAEGFVSTSYVIKDPTKMREHPTSPGLVRRKVYTHKQGRLALTDEGLANKKFLE
jgi:hypothetical protein